MKQSLAVGTTFVNHVFVEPAKTIGFMGEDLRVYATPYMVLDCEQTCRKLLLEHHDDGEDSVGARVEIDHLGPTLVNQTVTITAKVVELALPRITFEIEVKDEVDNVGRCRHIRFVVDKSKQGERLKKKAERVKAARGG